MRADATHRFEFVVDGGKRPPFACLARTRAEAEQIARNARAPVRLRRQLPLGPNDGDAVARRHLNDKGMLSSAWRDDILELVNSLDHVRFTGGAMWIAWVGSLSASEIVARGLRSCGCSGHMVAPSARGQRAVEAPTALSARMTESGEWQLQLSHREGRSGFLEQFGWKECGTEDCNSLSVTRAFDCSIWWVALEMLAALLVSGDLRPGDLSGTRIDWTSATRTDRRSLP